jgi:hypothetical protein
MVRTSQLYDMAATRHAFQHNNAGSRNGEAIGKAGERGAERRGDPAQKAWGQPCSKQHSIPCFQNKKRNRRRKDLLVPPFLL